LEYILKQKKIFVNDTNSYNELYIKKWKLRKRNKKYIAELKLIAFEQNEYITKQYLKTKCVSFKPLPLKDNILKDVPLKSINMEIEINFDCNA
jgi:hypothetical protein